MNDLCQQNLKNDIPMARLETYTMCVVFGDLFVSVPVVIDFSVRETNGIQNPCNVTIQVADRYRYEWDDLSWQQQNAWRAEMLQIWNAKHGLLAEKVTA